VASAHEVMRQAAALCDEAREIEKGCDGVIRMPHKKTGEIVSKTALISKPE
ncbi:MAG TPA: methylenetetrahydromethanopterin dehydrogenase, partial [Methanocorpusculum sp.]|nr:methylenetetrahydromethanopterin dehydrogenase [Methanocorpusculum sp.]